MICRACRNLHKGKPEECPHGCACQHKGELVKPVTFERHIVGFECRNCGVMFLDPEDPCACEEFAEEDRREIYNTDL